MHQNATELVTDVGALLQDEQHALPEDQARALARKLYPRCDHDTDGKLFVRLGSGIRVPADSSAAKLLAQELFADYGAPQREAVVEKLVESKRASGMYGGY